MKKWQILLALLMVTVLTLTACGESGGTGTSEGTGDAPAGEEPAGDFADSFTVAQGAEPVSLNPYGQNDQSSSRVRVQIFDNLLTQDKNMEFVPGLAESWEQIDDLTVEFKLRQGVKFHNGEDFVASDVKYSIQQAIASPNTSNIVSMIDGDNIEVVDDSTVRIKTFEPFGPLLAHLSHPAAAIVSESSFSAAGDDVEILPNGTGPYKLQEWVRGDAVTLERFDDYWGEPAKTKTVVFRPIAENANRTIELETNQVQISYDIAPNDVARVDENDELQLFREPNFSTTYVGFNIQKAPLDNVLVRQAINHAVNMEEVVDVVYHGAGNKAVGPLGPNVTFANTELEGYDYNPEKAKELLAEAGYPDGFDITIWTNENQQRMDIAEVLQNQLNQVGIRATSEVVEWGAYLSRTAAGEHDMFILGWTTVTGDADYGLYALFHSSQFGDAGNRTFYKNEDVDRLLDEARVSVDPAEREAKYKEVQQIITEDAPWIFTWTGEDLTAAREGISGFELHPAGHYRLKNVTYTP